MILEHLTNFTVVILIQFVFFAFHAYAVGEWGAVGQFLKRGLMLGLPFGIAFDLLIGHSFGMYDYAAGYTWWFLIINGLFFLGLHGRQHLPPPAPQYLAHVPLVSWSRCGL